MLEIASQIIICLILAALLGGIIGYLLGKTSCEKNRGNCNHSPEGTHDLHIDQQHGSTGVGADIQAENKIVEEVVVIKEMGAKPVLLTAAREGGKDNLQKIKGIGNVLEALLNETGFYHFDQIANLTKEEILWLDNSMSFPGRIEREKWVSQAKDLAAGISTEYTDRINSGEVKIPNN